MGNLFRRLKTKPPSAGVPLTELPALLVTYTDTMRGLTHDYLELCDEINAQRILAIEMAELLCRPDVTPQDRSACASRIADLRAAAEHTASRIQTERMKAEESVRFSWPPSRA